jgi:diphosphomevalonate decarboxylase
MEVMEAVQNMRSQGIEAYFTMDAGPNVKVLCLPEDEQKVYDQLKQIPSVKKIFTCHPGPGVTILPTGEADVC